jgi:hypothetical protein
MARTAFKPKRRSLLEQVAFATAPTAAPLKIDEAAGVIFRVKVLGRFSRNNHGVQEAENGTEYTPGAMRSALTQYEGAKVKANHPPDRNRPAAERPVEDTFGVLRNCVIENDESGNPAVWADLHCLTSHPMYRRVIEDVQKGLGVYGLSHNAASSRERLDRATKRLVIEEVALVRSVDLVDRPATNRNLWESESRHVAITLRSLLEGLLPKWKKNRRSWADRLLEDDAMAPMMDAPVEGDAAAEPEDQLWSGFQAAITGVLDKYKSGDITADDCCKQIKDWVKAHDKLTGSSEPEPVEESDDEDDDKKKSDMEAKCESLTSENKALRLCLLEGVTNPTPAQLKAICRMESEAEQKELIASFKGQGGKPGGGFRSPKSVAPGSIKPAAKPGQPAGKQLTESEEPKATETLAMLRVD